MGGGSLEFFIVGVANRLKTATDVDKIMIDRNNTANKNSCYIFQLMYLVMDAKMQIYF